MLLLPAVLALACGGGQGGAVANARQAAPRGAKVFDKECGGCHGAEGQGVQGTPPLMGAGALPTRGASGKLGPFHDAQQLFDYVKQEMPLPKAQVGSLSDSDYWAVVEFMIRGTGRSVPEGGLTAENAASVTLNPR